MCGRVVQQLWPNLILSAVNLYVIVGWTGVISIHHQIVLQRCSRCPACLWHHKVSVHAWGCCVCNRHWGLVESSVMGIGGFGKWILEWSATNTNAVEVSRYSLDVEIKDASPYSSPTYLPTFQFHTHRVVGRGLSVCTSWVVSQTQTKLLLNHRVVPHPRNGSIRLRCILYLLLVRMCVIPHLVMLTVTADEIRLSIWPHG